MGVWIETNEVEELGPYEGVTPRVGVWIETGVMMRNLLPPSHPSRGGVD